MANVRSKLGDVSAKALLATAKKLGVQVSLTHRTEDAVTLWAHTTGGEQLGELEENGAVVQVRQRTFVIPEQTGFTPATDNEEVVIQGDSIEYLSRKYRVVDVQKSSYSNVYECTCIQEKALSWGS